MSCSPEIDQPDLQPPPRWFIVVVVGGCILMIAGATAGLLVFKDVLRPGQHQRVIGVLPFMELFLPYRAYENVRIPTGLPQNSAFSAS